MIETQAPRSPAHSVLQTFLVRICILCLGAGTGITVARTLAPAGRGEQAAMGLWPIVLCGVATFGIPIALNYQTKKYEKDSGQLLTVATIMALISGVFTGVAGVFLIPQVLRHYTAPVIHFAQLMMVFAPQLMLASVLRAHLEARGLFSRSNGSLLWPPVMTLTVLLSLKGGHALTPYTAVLSYLAPGALQTTWMAWTLRHAFGPLTRFTSAARTLLSYGLRSYGLDIINTLSTQVDQAMIVGFLSARDLGVYSVALNVSRMLNVVQTSLVIVLFPTASGSPREQAILMVTKAARISLAATCLIAVAFVAVIPKLLPLVYGRAFSDAVVITQILTLEIILSGTTFVFGQAFMATGRPGVMTLLQAIGLAITVPLLVLLVPRLGLIGAAIALLASTTIRFFMVLASYPIVLHAPVPRLLLRRSDVKDILARVGI